MKKIKKIALVESKAVKTHVFSRKYSPRLGLPILSAILKKEGYEVELFFQELEPLDIDVLMQFDMVGISSLTSTVKEAYRLGDILKERGQTVVMGGPHVSGMAEQALEHSDFVVRGEGEITFLELLKAINNGKIFSDLSGISFKENGIAVHNPSEIIKVNMETLPASDFSSCKSYSGPQDYPGGMMFSRGCPYDCNFCSVTTTFGKKYRYKSADQVIAELTPFAGRPVSFVDDNFAANPKKTRELLVKMIEKKVTPSRFSCQLRVNVARDEELLGLMQRAGCRVANVGLESVNPETLKQYHKGQTYEQLISAIEAFKKYDIGLHGMFVLGADNDTVDTIKETVDFAIDQGIDTIQLCALTPFPGTAVYDQLTEEKRVLHQQWELYDGLHVVIRPKKMTPYELQTGILREMKRFYSIKHSFKINWRKKWRVFSRLVGWQLIKRWEKENSDYFEHLKNLP